MNYAYPVVFTPTDKGYDVSVPDLPGCFSFGATQAEAEEMARDAISMWLCDAEDRGERIPQPGSVSSPDAIVKWVSADTGEYRLTMWAEN
jgi:predicted RNase H-like HicB family nuclease